MSNRISSVAVAFALIAASFGLSSNASARDGGSGTSRSCLTSAARNLLSRIEAKFGAMQIVSTCRPGATVAGSGRPSKHASGNAIDFEAGGRKGAVVAWLAATHSSGGTMTYADSSHIHVDIGQHFVSLSGGGTRTASRSSGSSRRYASNDNDTSDSSSSDRSSSRRARRDDQSDGSRVASLSGKLDLNSRINAQ